jgi:hypothetical protein
MSGESAAGEKSFTIRASGFTLWKKTITVSTECIQVIKSSGKIEASCALSKAKLASCLYWESRAGLLGPVTTRKLHLTVWDTGVFSELPDKTTFESFVEYFTESDVQKVAEAIATLRPDILVVRPVVSLDYPAVRKLLSAPSGDWTCPHCKGLNPISEPLWKQQQARTAQVTIVGMVLPAEAPCTHCKADVKIDDIVPKQKACFIATAALGSAAANQLVVLQQFRDAYLHSTTLGRLFVTVYYRISPPIAAVVSRHPRLRIFVRDCIVLPAAATVSKLKLGDDGTRH